MPLLAEPRGSPVATGQVAALTLLNGTADRRVAQAWVRFLPTEGYADLLARNPGLLPARKDALMLVAYMIPRPGLSAKDIMIGLSEKLYRHYIGWEGLKHRRDPCRNGVGQPGQGVCEVAL